VRAITVATLLEFSTRRELTPVGNSTFLSWNETANLSCRSTSQQSQRPAPGDDGTILYFETLVATFSIPTVERLPVEEALPLTVVSVGERSSINTLIGAVCCFLITARTLDLMLDCSQIDLYSQFRQDS
jgi:hypothetical protein